MEGMGLNWMKPCLESVMCFEEQVEGNVLLGNLKHFVNIWSFGLDFFLEDMMVFWRERGK